MKANSQRACLLPAIVTLVSLVLLALLSFVPEPAEAQELAASGEPVVRYEWVRPEARENGEPMTVEEIGGYELLIDTGNGEYQKILIEDGTATQFDVIGQPTGDYTASIAVFDTNGLYSQFVEIQGTVQTERPAAPAELRSRQLPSSDPAAACAADPDCVVAMLSARFGSATEGN